MEIDVFFIKKAQCIAEPLREFFYRLKPFINPFENEKAAQLICLKNEITQALSQSRPDNAMELIKRYYGFFVSFINEFVPVDKRSTHHQNFLAIWQQVTNS